jgi:hypothetical protein
MTITVRAPSDDFAAMGSGEPTVIWFHAASRETAELIPGLRAIVAQEDAGGLVLSLAAKPAAPGRPTFLEVMTPPTGCIAIVGKDQASIGKLSEWWLDRSGESPAIIVEADGARGRAAALAKINRALSEELKQNRQLAVDALNSLARLRQEYEEARELIGRLDRHLSGRRVGELTLASDYAPGAAAFEAPHDSGRSGVRQPLDVPGRQLASLAIHVARTAQGAAGSVRARLLETETQRVLGSWLIPIEEVALGWMRLELPTPATPFAGSVVLELEYQLTGEPPALSQFVGVWDEALSAIDGAGQRQPFMLAHRTWTANPGDWYVQPRFWDLRDANKARQQKGVAYQLSEDTWKQATRLDIGGPSNVIVDPVDRRFITCPTPGGAAGLQIKGVTIDSGNLLTFASRLVDARAPAIEVAVLVAATGQPVTFAPPLDDFLPPLSFSGWKSFRPLEEGLIQARVPEAERRTYDIYLLSRSPDRRCSPFTSRVEWPWGKVSEEEPSEVDSMAEVQAEPLHPEVKKIDATVPDTCLFSDVDLVAWFTGSEDRENITLSVRNLSFHGRKWPRFNFKLTREFGVPGLEFRMLDGEPPFIVWPSEVTDVYGPVYKVSAGRGVAAPEMNPSLANLNIADRRFLDAVAQSLPGYMMTLARKRVSTDHDDLDLEEWARIADEIAAYFRPRARQADQKAAGGRG